jgi:hypothetical protein
MDGWEDGWMDGRMGGWVGGWVGGWMGGWVGGWVDGLTLEQNNFPCTLHLEVNKHRWAYHFHRSVHPRVDHKRNPLENSPFLQESWG